MFRASPSSGPGFYTKARGKNEYPHTRGDDDADDDDDDDNAGVHELARARRGSLRVVSSCLSRLQASGPEPLSEMCEAPGEWVGAFALSSRRGLPSSSVEYSPVRAFEQ